MAAKTDENTPLTAKQEAFVNFYMQYFDATKSAIKAGYSSKHANRAGTRLLKQVNVAKRLRDLQDELAENLGMSRQMQIDKLNEIYNRRKPQAADRMKLKIIEMQNKMLGFDTPKPPEEKNLFKIVEIPIPTEPYRGAREVDE